MSPPRSPDDIHRSIPGVGLIVVWLKLSDDFGDECARVDLSDAAFRTHVEAQLWTMRRESAGRLTFRDVRRFAESDGVDAAVAELLKAGFWTETGDGYVIEHHMDVQIEPEVMEQRRKMTAERQRRKRFKAAQLESASDLVTRDVTRDVPRDNTRDPGLGWAGRDRKTPNYVAPKNREVEEDGVSQDEWPAVTEPGAVWSDAIFDREQ